ncbi:hypothetical protein [Paenibacillus sp. GYB003]|uniref:hypothetical protein n=1 Tax=Paenibacillus sp. GYB003 TaxID=2994392 RepID=UPI002F96DAA0
MDSRKRSKLADGAVGRAGSLEAVRTNPEAEYIINARGGIVYADIEKHALLKIPQSSRGRIYHVLSAGLHYVSKYPIVTVDIGRTVKVYRLPEDLKEWVFRQRPAGTPNVKSLPADVRFGFDGTRYVADIL